MLLLSETLKLFIAFKMAYSCYSSLGGNLDFPDLLQKKIYSIDYWYATPIQLTTLPLWSFHKAWFTLHCKSAATCNRQLWDRKFSNFCSNLQWPSPLQQLHRPAASVNKPLAFFKYLLCSSVWPDKNRQMSVKVAQKWFH